MYRMSYSDAISFLSERRIDLIIYHLASLSGPERLQLAKEAVAQLEPELLLSVASTFSMPSALSAAFKESMKENSSKYRDLFVMAAAEGNYAQILGLRRVLAEVVGDKFLSTLHFHAKKSKMSGYVGGKPMSHWAHSLQQSQYLAWHQLSVLKLHHLLESEKTFQWKTFIPLLGAWRKDIAIACQTSSAVEHFGTLRTVDNGEFATPMDERYYGSYFEKYYQKKGGPAAKGLEGTLEGCFIKMPGGDQTLTQYGFRDREWRDKQFSWIHTSPEHFPMLFDAIEEKINRFLSEPTVSLEKTTQDIAYIHWLFAQASPYHRGSAAVAKILVEALFQLRGFKISGWKTEPDCEALISDTPEEYMMNYASFMTECKVHDTNEDALPLQITDAGVAHEYMPPALQALLELSRCTKETAERVMTTLSLSERERFIQLIRENPKIPEMSIAFAHLLFSDNAIIAHCTGLIDIADMAAMPIEHLKRLLSDNGLQLFINGSLSLSEPRPISSMPIALFSWIVSDQVAACITAKLFSVADLLMIPSRYCDVDHLAIIFSEHGLNAIQKGYFKLSQLSEMAGLSLCSRNTRYVIEKGYISKEEAFTRREYLDRYFSDHAIIALDEKLITPEDLFKLGPFVAANIFKNGLDILREIPFDSALRRKDGSINWDEIASQQEKYQYAADSIFSEKGALLIKKYGWKLEDILSMDRSQRLSVIFCQDAYDCLVTGLKEGLIQYKDVAQGEAVHTLLCPAGIESLRAKKEAQTPFYKAAGVEGAKSPHPHA